MPALDFGETAAIRLCEKSVPRKTYRMDFHQIAINE